METGRGCADNRGRWDSPGPGELRSFSFLTGYRLPGYERAVRSVFARAQSILIIAHLPPPMQREPAQDESWSHEQLIVGKSVGTNIPVRTELVLPFRVSLDGDYGYVVAQAAGLAEQHAREMEAGMLRIIGEVCDASGQVVKRDTAKSACDQFLDTLDQVRLDFDSSGRPDFASFHWVQQDGAGTRYFNGAEVFRDFALAATVEQRQRLLEIVERKQRERATGERYF